MAQANTPRNEIQSLVESFTDQLTLLVKRSALQQVQYALGDVDWAGAATQRGRRVRVVRMGRSSKRRGGGKRSPEQVEKMGETLLGFIKKNPGKRGEQIAEALKTDVKTMRLPILKLIAEKKIKTKGQRRGMTYFAS